MIRKTFHWGHGHVKNLWSDSLYRNSFWLMAGSFTSAGVGFVYWILASKLYSPSQIGVATTFLSAASLIHNIAVLGFGTTLIRYLPHARSKEKIINSTLTVLFSTSLIIGGVYLIGIPVWTLQLNFLYDTIWLFFLVLFFFPLNTINAVTDSIFTALREAQWVFASNTIQSLLKLFVLAALSTYGTIGIIGSNIFAVFATVLICLFWISLKYKIRFKFVLDRSVFYTVKKFAIGSYISSLITSTPILLVPLIVTNMLSPEQTAYYYMPNMISILYSIIPSTFARSYFTENSHLEQIKPLKKPLTTTYLIMFPLAIIFIFFGPFVLGLFGKAYAYEGQMLLSLLIISVLISALNLFFSSRLLIKNNLSFIIKNQIVTSSVYLLTIYLLIHNGILAVGYSSILAQFVSLTIYLYKYLKSDE